jgi:phosphoglycerate dehydrogenase-like enzyme
VMRERTPLTRQVLQRLPRLKLIASTGPVNASIDLQAARERGIAVTNTGYGSTRAIELTWALILGAIRHLVQESNSMRGGGWQTPSSISFSAHRRPAKPQVGPSGSVVTYARLTQTGPPLPRRCRLRGPR